MAIGLWGSLLQKPPSISSATFPASSSLCLFLKEFCYMICQTQRPNSELPNFFIFSLLLPPLLLPAPAATFTPQASKLLTEDCMACVDLLEVMLVEHLQRSRIKKRGAAGAGILHQWWQK